MKVYQRILAVFSLCLLAIGTAIAQSDRGTIAGSIVDGTGAAVSGAKRLPRSLPAISI